MNFGIIPASWSSYLHSALRVISGLLFMEHGTTKLFQWPFTDMFKDGVPLGSLMGVGGILELVGGLLIVLGLFTRITAFVLAGMMAVAYFMFHLPASFFPVQNGGDAAVLFCFIFLFLAAAGAGPLSLDNNKRA
jgi:putative oxidoreductase